MNSVWLDDITWPGGSTTDFESDTVDNTPLGFSSRGDETWYVYTGRFTRGGSGKSVRTNPSLSDNQETYLAITKTVGAGVLTFWVWVSSEKNDFFEFYLDNEMKIKFAPGGGGGHQNEVSYPASNKYTIAVGASNDGIPSVSLLRSDSLDVLTYCNYYKIQWFLLVYNNIFKF